MPKNTLHLVCLQAATNVRERAHVLPITRRMKKVRGELFDEVVKTQYPQSILFILPKITNLPQRGVLCKGMASEEFIAFNLFKFLSSKMCNLQFKKAAEAFSNVLYETASGT